MVTLTRSRYPSVGCRLGRWRQLDHHGHGARVETGGAVFETSIVPKPNGRDMLSAVQTMSGDTPDLMDTAMTMREVWAAAPQAPDVPEDVFGTAPRTLLAHFPFGSEVAARARREDRLEIALEGLDAGLDDAAVLATLASYPKLREASLASANVASEGHASQYVCDHAQPTWDPQPGLLKLPYLFGRDWVSRATVVSLQLEPTDGDLETRATEAFDRLGSRVDDSTRLIEPSLGGSDAVTFLTAWWLLLLGLSQLVRYEPAVWTAAIDLERSELAVPLEQASDYAAFMIPNVIADQCREQDTSG